MINHLIKKKGAREIILFTLHFSFILITLSCHTEKLDDQVGIRTNTKSIVEINQNLKFSQFAESIEYHFLENEVGSMIAEINKVKESQDLFFVLDKEILETLFVFDKNGRFKFNIETGPGAENEPISIQDFTIDEKKKEILVLDRKKQRIMFFDFEGHFIKTTSLHTFADFIEVYDDSRIIIFRNIYYQKSDPYGNHQLLILNNNQKVEKLLLPLKAGQTYPAFYESINPLSKRNNKITFQPALSNSVYIIEPSGTYTELKIELGEKDLISRIQDLKAIQEFTSEINSDNILYSVGLTFSTKEMNIFLYRNREKFFFLSNSEKDYNVSLYSNYQNDLSDFQFIQPVSQNEGYVYFYTPPEVLTNIFFRNSDMLPEAILNNLNEERIKNGEINPLILKLKLIR